MFNFQVPAPFLNRGVLQRNNEPWDRNAADVYGRKRRLTFSEAIGTTGGTQTTNLDARLNGKFFGKFSNVAHHMGGVSGVDLQNNNYPALCTGWGVDAPHAEDYLLTALETEWVASGNWLTRYPYQGGVLQQQSLLSIRMNRSPCPRCARNLIAYCAARNLSLRVKATFFHTETDINGDTGVAILDAAHRPVRQWDMARVRIKAPSGAPAHLATWGARQLGKKSNPFRHEPPNDVEDNQWGGFNGARVNHNIGRTVGWGAAPGNLSRAAIQNKPVGQVPPVYAPVVPQSASERRPPPAFVQPAVRQAAPPVYRPSQADPAPFRSPSAQPGLRSVVVRGSVEWAQAYLPTIR